MFCTAIASRSKQKIRSEMVVAPPQKLPSLLILLSLLYAVAYTPTCIDLWLGRYVNMAVWHYGLQSKQGGTGVVGGWTGYPLDCFAYKTSCCAKRVSRTLH